MAKLPRTYRRIHVAAKDREYITANLALLLKAGVTVGEALETLKQTTKAKPLKRALDTMLKDIDEGATLGNALERSGIMSEQTLALISLGEQSGNLAENLQVAASQEEKQRILHAKIRSALMYPSFVLGITVIVALGVAWFLLPRLAGTFTSLNVQLPFITKLFIDFGIFLQQNGIWAVPLGLAISGLFGYILFGAPKTKHIGYVLLMHTPGIGRLMREVEIARFGYLLGTLLNAGLSVTQALELLARATSARSYRQFYNGLEQSFGEGYSFSNSFRNIKHSQALLPLPVQQMVIAGERSGALPDTLKNIGAIYEQKADTSTQNLQSILEPIILVVVWLGVLGVAVAVILPIYSLVGGLGG